MKYIEEELRKRRGLASDQQDGRETTEVERLEAELYAIPENLKVRVGGERALAEETSADSWRGGGVALRVWMARFTSLGMYAPGPNACISQNPSQGLLLTSVLYQVDSASLSLGIK